ncbi:MAG TPA: RpiB/LacA/LacB family sugar-phosphate isomerase [Candidatus Limnocylindria bacterium]|nr:RpiB/LacA/LacB family sugar-phosphate isomerase [Candidatus Limnocylindria bacterium]
MLIALGTDHRGFAHKEFIKEHPALSGRTIEWLDLGAHSPERSDYPSFAVQVCHAIRQGKAERGVLLCGSGVGMAIAANRFKGIYAALVWNEEVARRAAQDDNANILVLPADFITHQQAVTMIGVWLTSSFKGERYQQRIEQVDALGGL